MEQQQNQNNSNDKKAIVFKGAVKFSEASQKVKAFRDSWPGADVPKGVYYDPKDILEYMKNVFEDLTEAQDRWIQNWNDDPTHEKFERENYTWQVGFYWMENVEDGKRKLDFYVVPALVSLNDKKKVIDYYDFREHPFLDRREKRTSVGRQVIDDDDEARDFSFNTGNMFP